MASYVMDVRISLLSGNEVKACGLLPEHQRDARWAAVIRDEGGLTYSWGVGSTPDLAAQKAARQFVSARRRDLGGKLR